MKSIQVITIFCTLFAFTASIQADQAKKFGWADIIDLIIQQEDREWFYKNPNSPHCGAKVEVNGVKGVLICPEGAYGKAILILSSGKTYEREANIEGTRPLSYSTTIMMEMSRRAWNPFTMDKHWIGRNRDNLAQDFESAWVEASSKADHGKSFSLAEMISKDIQQESHEGFYDNPNTPTFGAKVEVNGVKGLLFCPEAGIGKAFLILRSGGTYERATRIEGTEPLSYCPTVTVRMKLGVWNQFNMDKYWIARKRQNLANDFESAVYAEAKRLSKVYGQPGTIQRHR